MAESKPVQAEDLIEKGIFTDAKKEAKDLTTAIDVLTLSFSELVKIQKDGLANIKKIGGATDAKSLKETQEALNKVTEARKEAVKVDKALLDSKKKLDASEKEALKTAEKERKNSDEYIKAQAVQALVDKARIARLKALAIEQSNQIGLEQKLLAANTRLRLDRAALTGVEADYQEQLKAINEQLDKNNELIKENSDKQKQQALTVGDYKNQIKEALAETTGFGTVISKVSGFVNAFEETLRAQKVAQAEATLKTTGDTAAHATNIAAIKAEEAATQKLSLAKRALNAITSPAGLALLAVAALAALAKATYDLNQAVQDSVELSTAQTKSFLTQNDVYIKLTKATIAYRKEIGDLELKLQEINDTAGDQAEIAADETIALGLRKKALDEAATARIKAAEQELDIATRQKEIADLELERAEANPLVGKGNALQEFRDKQVEAQKKLFDASDKLGDLDRILSQEKRKFTIQEITDEIELIRSKKLGADSAVETLKKQVADETTILSNRRAAFAKLEAEQKKAQDEEIQLLTKFGLTKKEIDGLIAETDAVKLARELKSFGQAEKNFRLSVGQTEELAKVVLEAQKNKLDRTDAQNKLDEKAIENTKTLLALERSLLENEQKRVILDAEETLKNKEKAEQVAQQAALTNSRLFNRGKEKAALDALEKTEDARNKAYEETAKLENDQFLASKKLIEDAVKAEVKEKEIGKKEIELLEAEHLDRLNELQDKYLSKRSAKVDFERKLEIERTDATLKGINQVTAELEKALDRRAQREAKEADRAINKREQTIEIQQRLAERGLKNTLAEEKAALNKQEVERREAEEKAIRQQQALALVQQFNGFLQAALKETPTPTGSQAIMSATRNTFLAKGIAEGFTRVFEDGGVLEGPSHKEGGIRGTGRFSNIEVEGGEYIVNKKATKKNKALLDMVNANVDLAIPDLGKIEDQKGSTAYNVAQSLILQQNNELGKMKSILEQIASKPALSADHLGNIIETSYKNKVRHETTHILNSKTRI